MILIVGVTGVLGRETARQLLEAGYSVRGMTRTPEKAADLKELGVEIMQGDLIDKHTLERACRGVEAVLAAAHQLMGTGKYSSEAVDDTGHRTLIDVAKAARVKHFVYTSVHNVSPDNPVDFYRTKYKIERYLRGSGMSYTILRPPAFMEWHIHNLLGATIPATGKATIYGAGNNPINFMAGKDVAHIAVLALTDPNLKGHIIEMGGPDNVSKNQIADMYSRFSGKHARVSHIPSGMMKVMSPIMHPFQPVLSRLMAYSAWVDTTNQSFDPSPMLKEFPMTLTHVEDFIREHVSKN